MKGKSGNAMVGLSLTRNTVFMTRVDPLTRGFQTQVLPLGYDALNDFGAVVDPPRLAETLRDYFTAQELPVKVRVGLQLKYLDLRHLDFPVIPEEELDQIVRDEAVRESIFSFSGEAVAVAYKFTASQPAESKDARQEVLVATIPQVVIDSISETFALAELKLLSMQPNWEGMSLFWQTRPPVQTPAILLNVFPEQTEFYIVNGRKLVFWRHLPVGAADTGGLAREVRMSLEHYQRRNPEAMNLNVKIAYILGTKAPLELDETLKTEHIAGDVKVDLQALALQDPETLDFSFWERPDRALAWQWVDFAKLWPGALILLLGLNGWGAWRLSGAAASVQKDRKAVAVLKQEQQVLGKQLQQLQASQALQARSAVPVVNPIRMDLLLEELRRLVPEKMRFVKIVVDGTAKRLQIEGYCLERAEIDGFIEGLKGMNCFQKFRLIELAQEPRSQLKVTAFRIELELGVKTP